MQLSMKEDTLAKKKNSYSPSFFSYVPMRYEFDQGLNDAGRHVYQSVLVSCWRIIGTTLTHDRLLRFSKKKKNTCT